ncbi:hypothetical protein [Streptomyces brevispora]|uniref:Uncharacterized protein n=1 Tax=Streptomyces brevispora TaxID=887462 RepID=A0ABZ1G380_9ACTN|nr:hypothetical protein [Streptomyces brevispora]WSC14335.1 hypothetical protein OIE64_16795 [Streptomyces brevispora]
MTEPTRPRLARLLDAITHTGPGYDTTTEHPMPEPTQEQLLHLANRARDGVALDAEHDALTAGIIAVYAALTDANEDAAEAHDHNDRTCEAVARAERAEAAIERVRAVLAPYDWPHAQARAAIVRAALDQPTT